MKRHGRFAGKENEPDGCIFVDRISVGQTMMDQTMSSSPGKRSSHETVPRAVRLQNCPGRMNIFFNFRAGSPVSLGSRVGMTRDSVMSRGEGENAGLSTPLASVGTTGVGRVPSSGDQGGNLVATV